ncbi:unnamed protein product [Schistocephalus solidus]|uniref:C2H2-type domain-containing protein n=1 Tax=Schistocephalus solidus TaxID=70667 RepID=A0A183SS77_SCHSO|nr:unnamed protein product [Schistocephalus solidus]
MAHTILRQVEADLRFWEDIVHHVDIPDESLPGIVAIGDNIRKVKPDVEQILETLKTAGHSSSRSVDEGFGLETDALILEGGYQSPESQSAHPLTQVAPACMVDGDNASQTNASTVQDSVACQILTTKDPKPRSSHADSSSKISQMDMVSTAGSQDHTANAFDYETSQPNASIDKNTSASGYPVLNSAHREGKQQTDSLLANWLCPICQIGFQEKQEYITHRSSAKHSWYEQCKDYLPDSAFKKTYEAVLFGGEPSDLTPVNLHWFPNRNIMDEKLDSFLYDLSKVGNEILEHSSRPLYKLNVHCANAETSSSENDPVTCLDHDRREFRHPSCVPCTVPSKRQGVQRYSANRSAGLPIHQLLPDQRAIKLSHVDARLLAIRRLVRLAASKGTHRHWEEETTAPKANLRKQTALHNSFYSILDYGGRSQCTALMATYRVLTLEAGIVRVEHKISDHADTVFSNPRGLSECVIAVYFQYLRHIGRFTEHNCFSTTTVFAKDQDVKANWLFSSSTTVIFMPGKTAVEFPFYDEEAGDPVRDASLRICGWTARATWDTIRQQTELKNAPADAEPIAAAARENQLTAEDALSIKFV